MMVLATGMALKVPSGRNSKTTLTVSLELFEINSVSHLPWMPRIVLIPTQAESVMSKARRNKIGGFLVGIIVEPLGILSEQTTDAAHRVSAIMPQRHGAVEKFLSTIKADVVDAHFAG